MYRTSSDTTSLNAPSPGFARPGPSPYAFGASDDPRSSSSQSLIPSASEREDSGRRRLLVIYIHGFMGNDASFQSFPAHVHKYLKFALSETHVVHTKVYPKYKTYKAVDVARDNFSQWLAPHESPTTDVILVGHSMGGLLAADIALAPSRDQYSGGYFLHRILGTVNLDAPFLGLHPSVITAGIASLFRPKSETVDPSEYESSQSLSHVTSGNTSIYSDPSASQLSSPSPSSPGTVPYGMTFDPTFNPNFPNDVRLQDRGWWKNIVHFVEKHNSEGLFDAASNHIMSHLEFGGCLMDFNGLKTRYENIRRLEDVDDLKHHGFPHVPPQVRFIQYYTVCHGYPKKPKGGESINPAVDETPKETCSAPLVPQTSSQSRSSPPITPKLINAIPEEDAPPKYTPYADDDSSSLEILPPEPMAEEVEPLNEFNTPSQGLGDNKNAASGSSPPTTESTGDGNDIKTDTQQTHESSLPQEASENATETTTDIADQIASLGLDLPPIPELPAKPEQPDLDQYTDKETRKQAEKEAKQVHKEYARLVKDRDKAIKGRQKFIDKGKKKLIQEAEKREKEERKRRQKEEKAAATSISKDKAGPSSAQPYDYDDLQADFDSNAMSSLPSPREQSRNGSKPPKQPKERKFCTLPSKVNGQVDPKWVKIFMKDMDQVAAHTSLFFRKEHYERFVCDVGEIIVSWVQDDMTKRTILEMEDRGLDVALD
ncbi:hypothetical protein F4818DRAFT_374270 [Hypoxylon cercidicola]|nr:hypothetical protein F4818DRAFT_374270 [Hypoxylon cercidicola]